MTLMDVLTDSSIRSAEFAMVLLLSSWLCVRLFAAVKAAAVARHARITAADDKLLAAHEECAKLRAGMAALSSSLAHLEQQLQHLSGRQNRLELRDPVRQTYEPAIRMVRKGAGVEDLVSTCGLARGEAELIMMLHNNATTIGEARCA